MFYTAGFFANVAAGASYATVTNAVDQGLTQGQNGGYILPKRMRVRSVHAMAATITAARVNAPSLRNYALPEIYPVNPAATVPDSVPVIDYEGQGFDIQANEEFKVEESNGAGAGEDTWAAVWLTDGATAAPPGPRIVIPCTQTITTVKGQWVLSPLTFGTVLPSGQYAVVGMECKGVGVYLARLVFPGFSQFRPGVIAQNTYGRTDRFGLWRNGRYGLFGTFYNTAQPQVEVFGLAAAAVSVIVLLEIVKIG